MKKKKRMIVIIILLVITTLLILKLTSTGINKYTSSSTKNVFCTLNNELIDGITNEETIQLQLENDIINKIILKRKITLDSKYDFSTSYAESIKYMLNLGYKDANSYSVNIVDHYIYADVETTKLGLILNNLNITYANDDGTSLRYDVLNDFETADNIIKIDSKYSDNKTLLTNNNYTCEYK